MKRNRILSLVLTVGLSLALVFSGGCVPSGEGEGSGIDLVTMVIFLVLIFGLMYLVLIRPQRKRQKEHEQMVLELGRGDKIITAGGIYGVIESISEESIVIKIESGMTMRVARGSIAGKREH